ncbi:MAG: hypothetical protein H7Y59_12450 [Anaerolineales bacterium]|nr:hypothetical protein [Anaerolineales bacterium]
MRILVSLITLCILVFSVGCQSIPVETDGPVSPTQGDITQMSTSIPTPSDAGLQDLIEKAKADLAQRLTISVDQIILLEATSVVWPDASLGCPQPGMVYIQVPEDGLLIRLQVSNQIYPYHSGGFREPFLCEIVVKDTNPPPQIDFFNLTPSKHNTSSTPDNSIPPGEGN